MRRLSIFIVTLISLILMGAPAAFARSTEAPSAQTRSTGSQPFEASAFNPCYGENGEFVTIVGRTLFDVKLMQDAAGGLHTIVQGQLQATGVGEVSGTKYVGASTGFITENATAAGVLSFTGTATDMLIALDKDEPDLVIRIHFHLTINANGDLTSLIEKIDALCR